MVRISLVKSALCVVVAGVVASGCNRSINAIAPENPQRLPAAPVESVNSSRQLPPPSNTVSTTSQAPTAPQAPTTPSAQSQTETQVASVEPPSSGEPVSRDAVVGAWNVLSDGPSCKIILAFTQWTGGFRAATRNCSSSDVSNVNVWDVKGQQVVLMDRGGNTIARLYKSGYERFDGTTSSGKPISFSR